jgi:hypothetical protein
VTVPLYACPPLPPLGLLMPGSLNTEPGEVAALPGVPPPLASVAWQLLLWGLGLAYAGGAAAMTAMATMQLTENGCASCSPSVSGRAPQRTLSVTDVDRHLVQLAVLLEPGTSTATRGARSRIWVTTCEAGRSSCFIYSLGRSIARTSIEEGFRRLLEYVERNGDALVQKRYKDEDGNALGVWVMRQRKSYAEGTLDPERERRLKVLPGWTWRAR